MQAIAVFDRDHELLYVAKDYRTAAQAFFGDRYVSVKEDILIDGEYTTLEDHYGEGVVDLMVDVWDIEDFNTFWAGDFLMGEVQYYD